MSTELLTQLQTLIDGAERSAVEAELWRETRRLMIEAGYGPRITPRQIAELVRLEKAFRCPHQTCYERKAALWAALIKASGIAEGSFARTVSALIRDGFATQDAKGEPYRITEAGRKELSKLS